MKSAVLVLLALASLATTSGQAVANADLAKTKNCMACHALDKKVLGPAFRDVAAKYKGDATAQAKLIASITNGSAGKWGGPMAMSPNMVTSAEAATLAKWVLSQK